MTGASPAAWRFSVVDELNCYFDSPAEPANILLEIWVPGHLDAQRLRAAVTAVLTAYPQARARRARGSWWRSSYTWTVPPQTDHDVVSVTDWHTDSELDAARASFLATTPPVDQSPPFRLLLARGPQLDSLILNASHAAVDGRSCLALMRRIAGAYSADADGYRDSSTAESGPVRERVTPPAAVSEETQRHPGWRVARIAPQPAGRRAPGYGFLLLGWPGIPVPPRQQERATVNDLLVAALIETITRWNAARRRPPRPIRITIPVDIRPPGHGDDFGNKTALCTVAVHPDDADADRVALVSAQIRQGKQRASRQVGFALSAAAKVPLPTAVKRRLLRVAVRCLGTLMSDTSLLTNMGNFTDPPCFGGLAPERAWISGFAHMPRGLCVGAITVAGRLQLCFRYRLALFDDTAAAEFAAMYMNALASLVDDSVEMDAEANR
jgi:NRPS condensation-like uncharacterized protein